MKNKKLLTIIGIALLLIVGISGTFAYYSVVGSNAGGTATVSAKSDEVGNVSLSGDGGALHINLTPSDVSNVAGGVFYGTATESGYSSVEEKLDVAKIEATTLPDNVKYTCTFDIKVKPESGSLTGITAGEILFSTISVDIDGVPTDKLAFSTLQEEKIYHASTVLYSGDTNYLRVSARITSSDSDGNESWLSNINGSFSVSSDNLKCTASKESIAVEENNYTISGKLVDENGNALTGYASLMSEPRTIELGNDGTFEIENVEPGTHSLYYMGETNPDALTKEEIKTQAKTKTTFKTVVAKDKNNLRLENRNKILNLTVFEKSGVILYDLIKDKSQNTTINYSIRSGSSDTNGIYTTTKTDSGLPVYFYRGNVDNNIIFGGFCWKIIRTTETQGIKLIYNGTPSNGTCNNTGTNSQIGTSAFNSNDKDNAYVGYMYGTTGSGTYYKTHTNTNNSTIKTYVDNWYENNLLLYASYIEDTVYCNDRNTTSGTNSELGSKYGTLGYGINDTAYAASSRSSDYSTSANPTLVCKNTTGSVASNNDAFTVSSDIGNGKLTYPVGLITSDEASFAGLIGYYMNKSNYQDTTNYLYTGEWFWTMTPEKSYGVSYIVILIDTINGYDVCVRGAVRPVISLKQGTKVIGTGTQENPYVVEM